MVQGQRQQFLVVVLHILAVVEAEVIMLLELEELAAAEMGERI